MADIRRNLVFLSKNITNLPEILVHLIQEDIISENEGELIENGRTRFERNKELLSLIVKKDWVANKASFLRIFRDTENGLCADVLEGKCSPQEPAKAAKPRRLVPEATSSSTIFQKFVTHRMGTKTKEISEQIWFGVTAPTKFYTGRETEMQILEKHWEDCMAKKTFTIVAVTGLGGVGKTELARNYALSFFESVGGHCIWIDSENIHSIEQSFHDLAKELKISLKDDKGKERIFQDIAEEVYKTLFGEKVLLIFDNLENYELPVLKLLNDLSFRKSPTVLKPFVITTSRFVDAYNCFGTECNLLDLQVLPKDSAVQFFSKSLKIKEPPEDNIKELIERLCQRLQFFPLAMQQATSYIKERLLFCGNVDEAITNYLTHIEMKTKTLLNYKLPQYKALDEISKTTFLTWAVTFVKLRESRDGGPLTTDILNIISFLSPDDIPIKTVVSILQRMGKVSDAANVDVLFELMRKYSIINYSKEKLISVHRLVQEVTRIELEERGECRSVLSGMTKGMIDILKAEEVSYKELAHLQMLWQHLTREKEMVEEHGELVSLICHELYNSGQYRHLLDFSRESGDFVESLLGEDCRLTLKIKFWKGIALGKLGNYSESLETLKYCCEKQKQMFGDEDGDWLQTTKEVGVVHVRLYEYETAMRIFEEALKKSEGIYGKEHRFTLELKHSVGLVLNGQGKRGEALKLNEEVLEGEKRLLGVENIDTLITKHNIASTKLVQKNFLEALQEFQEVLEIRERVLEFNHPDTLSTKHQIAVTYFQLGRYEESLQLFQEVHKIRVKILGPRHPDVVTTYLNMKYLSIASNKFLIVYFISSLCILYLEPPGPLCFLVRMFVTLVIVLKTHQYTPVFIRGFLFSVLQQIGAKFPSVKWALFTTLSKLISKMQKLSIHGLLLAFGFMGFAYLAVKIV